MRIVIEMDRGEIPPMVVRETGGATEDVAREAGSSAGHDRPAATPAPPAIDAGAPSEALLSAVGAPAVVGADPGPGAGEGAGPGPGSEPANGKAARSGGEPPSWLAESVAQGKTRRFRP